MSAQSSHVVLLRPPRWAIEAPFADLATAWAGRGRRVTTPERLHLLSSIDDGPFGATRRGLSGAAADFVEEQLARPKGSASSIDPLAAVRADMDEALLLAALWTDGVPTDEAHVRRAAAAGTTLDRSPTSELSAAGADARPMLVAAVHAAAASADAILRPRGSLVAWGRDLLGSVAAALAAGTAWRDPLDAALSRAIQGRCVPDFAVFRSLADVRAEAAR